MTPPSGTRIVVEEIKSGFWRVSVPGRPTPLLLFGTIFCLCWLAGWAVGEVFALRNWFSEERDPGVELTLLAWVLLWTLGGAAGVWLLNLILGISFGVETLFLTGRRLKLVRTLWGKAVPREFDLPHVAAFAKNPRWGVHFRFRKRTVSFGLAMTDEEREWLVGELGGILRKLREDP